MREQAIAPDLLSSFEQFHPNSRIWVYQADRELTASEIHDAEKKIQQFASQWQVHGAAANAMGELLFGRFVMFAVDENTPASGCSIDGSVQFVKQLGNEFQVDFFNRLLICFVHPQSNKIESLPMAEFKKQVKTGEITKSVILFDNTITTLKQLDGEWMIPASESWLFK